MAIRVPALYVRSSQQGLTTEMLRLPIEQLVKQATAIVADPRGEPASPLTRSELEDRQDTVATVHGERRRRKLTPEFLTEVADVYGEGERLGRAPTQHVADTLYGSRPAAGRWVREAREQGFLPPRGRSNG